MNTVPTVTLKLSEAMRKGAEGREQCRLHFMRNNWGCVCALGAAYAGVMQEHATHLGRVQMRHVGGLFPQLKDYVDMPPHGFRRNLVDAIAYLNDDMNWPILKIADWLESIGY